MILSLLAAVAVQAPAATIDRALMQLAGRPKAESALAATMAPDAWLLDPDVQPAAVVLARRTDAAPDRIWWPARTVTSCDGGLALSTGTMRDAGGTHRFVTIWERQTDRAWRWVFDGRLDGDSAAAPAAASLVAACGRVSAAPPDPSPQASGESGDGTLRWWLLRAADGERHRLLVQYLSSSGWKTFEDATVG